jgi:hypothetical protein
VTLPDSIPERGFLEVHIREIHCTSSGFYISLDNLSLQGLALTIVRSLGQAFDVCHKLNPKPKKKKGVESPAPESPKDEKEGTKEEGDEELKKEDLGSSQTPSGVPSSWKQFNTDLETALDDGSNDVGKENDKEIEDLNKDLMQLNFDPFSAPLSMPVANGNPLNMDPFQPPSGDAGAVAYPPLTVSNLSTSLPDFPDGVDPATASANVIPAHSALLVRPRPRPSLSGQQQVNWLCENCMCGN